MTPRHVNGDDKMRVVHVTTATNREAAGVQAAVDGMVAGLAGVPDLRLVQLGLLPEGETWECGATEQVRRVRLRSIGPRTFSYTPGLRAAIRAERPDVVHLHGIWQYPCIASTAAARRPGSTVVLSPHGMLSARALAHRSLKKHLAWLAYQRRSLARVDLIHVTSAAERADVRRAGLRQPVAMIPFGVNVPAHCPDRVPTGPMTALFLSRIHPIKGIVDLVRAWARVRPAGWRLVISGPDECGHRQDVVREISEQGLGASVSIEDPRWGRQREETVAAADLFVLPSHSENFGLAVAEALAQGVPVLTTRGAPWESIVGARCGWWVPVGERGLEAGIEEACGLGRDALLEMGRRGWRMMRDQFAWETCSARLAAVYRWSCGKGPRPESVSLVGEEECP
jgi:glycosyltransferase involved in cell wall biosynthesis